MHLMTVKTPSLAAGSECATANPAIARDSRAAMGDLALLTTGQHSEKSFEVGESLDGLGDGLGGWKRNERVEKSMKNAKKPNRVRRMKYEKVLEVLWA